jgi:membrane-associated phospholipid phosphatase
VFAICVTSRGPARAQPDPPRQARSLAQLEWNGAWAPFRPWEYAATSAAWMQGLLVRFVGPSPNRSRATFEPDERIVSALGVSGTAYDVAGMIANIGYLSSLAYRLLDSTVVPGLLHGSSDVALQMTWIDLEAFAISALVLWNAQLLYGRERPLYRDCPSSAAKGFDCDSQADTRYRSFITGHALAAATAAGLTCVHHSHLTLYGGVADDLACGITIGVAGAVGLGRIMMERHRPTDTLLAWGIGALAGYVVPSALHYGFGRAPNAVAATPRRTAPAAVRLAVSPGAATTMAGATLAGTF